MPLVEGAKRSKTTDSGEGSRAATDEEARAMIRHAHYRRASDKRASSARDVYYAALFYTGGRYSEPATWQWSKHVFLEPEKPGDPAFVPHLLYEAKHHKAARTEEVPIHPELAAILRQHRAWLRTQSEESIDRLCPHSGRRVRAFVNPDHPEAYVFPRIPPPHVWRSDRDAIGVAGLDRKGRTFSWHSCRDWFVTRLTEAGVQSTIARRLARHAPDPHEGYFNGSLSTLHEKISLLPSLWPVKVYDGPETTDKVILEKSAGLVGASSRNIRHANPDSTQRNPDHPEPARPPGFASKGAKVRESTCPLRGASLKAPQAGSTKIWDLEMPISGLQRTVDSKALARALASAAEALRLAALELAGESCDGERTAG